MAESYLLNNGYKIKMALPPGFNRTFGRFVFRTAKMADVYIMAYILLIPTAGDTYEDLGVRQIDFKQLQH